MSNKAQSINNKIEILGIPVDKVSFYGALKRVGELVESKRAHQVCTVNPEFIMHARENKEFRQALLDSSLNTADGIGIVWASKYQKSNLKNQKYGSALRFLLRIFLLKITLAAIIFNKKWLHSELPERVTGIDLVWELANQAQRKGWTIYLLGGEEGVADEVAKRVNAIYPMLRIVGAYAGSPNEKGIAERVAKTKPDILFVAYGSPKQEIFIHKNLKKFKAGVVIGVGGSFDFIAGRAKRAPQIVRSLGLEWLWRFVREPKRAVRIWNATIRFVWLVWKQPREADTSFGS